MRVMLEPKLVTTSDQLVGWAITENLGIVRGLTVRSRSIVGSFGAALQSLVGGNITLLSSMCEKAREEAFTLMLEHAKEMGADGIIAMRYDATELGPGMSEVLAYGTAVKLKPSR